MKGPILLLGAAAVVGFAVLAQAKAKEESDTATASVLPTGKSVADLTTAQKTKLETWAKSKNLPVSQAYDLAKSLFQVKF